MNAYNVAQELLTYLGTTRQVGHTTATIAGAKATPNAVIVTHNENMKEQVKKMAGGSEIQLVSLHEVEDHKLCGIHAPLLMDNCALHVLLGELVGTIAALRKANQEQADKIRLAKSILQ